jgi:hypothetical protein
MAGIPKRLATCLSVSFPTKTSLKILFKRCTIPVSAIASCAGKKIIITGVRIVPSPKPEKKVSSDAPKAVRQMITYSIINKNKLVEANVILKV